MNRIVLGLAAICLVVVCAAPASAVPIYFSDRATFDAATAGFDMDFESFEADFAVAPTVAFAGFTVSETGGTNALGQGRDFPALIPAAITDGTGSIIYDDNGSSIGSFFSFTDPVQAFGVDLAADADSTVTVGGGVLSTSVSLTANTPSFFGVIDLAGLSTISFDASGGPNVGFDAASFGSVPEPTSVLLFALGATGLLGCIRKRRRA